MPASIFTDYPFAFASHTTYIWYIWRLLGTRQVACTANWHKSRIRCIRPLSLVCQLSTCQPLMRC
ncbi:hypothetical protein ACRALDRAFT_1065907 [Sodiomyces alcalophilus JCM 7366]|uniref:uncharacterized protein n=1 Tax=Sodiomyces alcalophilus JCM 7366 TaxID=591952 RepID=UPI0039B5268E